MLGLAVIGGKWGASYFSERSISMVGGVVFILFGFYGIYSGLALLLPESVHPTQVGLADSAVNGLPLSGTPSTPGA
jgi:succinate-acetate transporter protein